MAADQFLIKGTTSKVVNVPMRSSTTGQLLGGLVAANMTIIYVREAAAPVTVTVVAGTLNTFISGGWVETAKAGNYQLSIPNAALATGADEVKVYISATGALDKQLAFPLTAINVQSASAFMTGINSLAPPSNWNVMAIDGSGRIDLGKWLGVAPVALVNQLLQIVVADYATGKAPLQPAVAGRSLGVSSSGQAGIDFNNVNQATGATTLNNVTIPTVTTLTGYTAPPSTNDIKNALEAAGGSLDTLLTRLSNARALLLDKLNITGNVASSAEVTAIQNNTSTRFVVPDFFERPDSGSTGFKIHLYIYDEVGNMEAPDSTPTITVVNQSGTNRAGSLGAITSVDTGHYIATYTIANTDATEQLIFEATVTEGGATRLAGATAFVVDTSAIDFTANDRTLLTNSNASVQAMLADYARRTGDVATPANINALADIINALNNLSAAGAQTAATNALAAYDAPTRAEATADKDEILSANNLVKVVTDKLNAMIKAIGSDWQFDAPALALAPTGSGDGGTAPVDYEAAADAVWTRAGRTVDSVTNAVTLPGGVATSDGQLQILEAFENISLSADERNAIGLALLVMPNGVESGYTLQQVMRLVNSVLGSNKDATHFRDPANTKNRVTFTVDSDGNRTVTGRDLT